MLTTPIYGFKKPELADSPPDITVTNPNWDKTELELKKNADAVAANSSAIGQKADKTQVSNPNLLINGDFQVWQRGTNLVLSSSKYGCDRFNTYPAITQIKNSGLQLKKQNTNAETPFVIQHIEGNENWSNKDFVFSVNFASVSSKAYLLVRNKTKSDVQLSEATIEIPVGSSGVFQVKGNFGIVDDGDIITVFIGFYSTASIDLATIKWVKLELGEIATSFSPRSYAEELAMCQRYYYKTNDNYSIGYTHSTIGVITNIRSEISFPVTMRIPPNFTNTPITDSTVFNDGSVSRKLLSIGVMLYTIDKIIINSTIDSYTLGKTGLVQLGGVSSLFDAEIY